MEFENLGIAAVIALSVTSLTLLVIRDWRWSILLLTVQYLAVFLLVAVNWPFQMAVVKLVAGWLACVHKPIPI